MHAIYQTNHSSKGCLYFKPSAVSTGCQGASARRTNSLSQYLIAFPSIDIASIFIEYMSYILKFIYPISNILHSLPALERLE